MYEYTTPDNKIHIKFNVKDSFSFSEEQSRIISMEFLNESYPILNLIFKEDEYFRFINSMSICDEYFYSLPSTDPITLHLGSPTPDGDQLFMNISYVFNSDYPSDEDDIFRISISQFSIKNNKSITRLFFDLNLYELEDFIYQCFRIIENNNVNYLSDKSLRRLLCNQRI